MTNLEQTFHDAILRTDFDAFVRRCFMTLNPGFPYLPNWHLPAIGYQLERIRRGEITRLIINMPPHCECCVDFTFGAGVQEIHLYSEHARSILHFARLG
jgi:hypothetical protein